MNSEADFCWNVTFADGRIAGQTLKAHLLSATRPTIYSLTSCYLHPAYLPSLPLHVVATTAADAA